MRPSMMLRSSMVSAVLSRPQRRHVPASVSPTERKARRRLHKTADQHTGACDKTRPSQLHTTSHRGECVQKCMDYMLGFKIQRSKNNMNTLTARSSCGIFSSPVNPSESPIKEFRGKLVSLRVLCNRILDRCSMLV